MSVSRITPVLQASLATLVEHDSCLTTVAELEALLDHVVEDGAPWLARVREVLPRLADALRAHFASEEAGPLFRALPQEFPHLTDRLRRLRDEHTPLLEQVAAMEERAAGLEEPEAYDLRELSGRLQLMVAVLRRHEAEEDEVILSAYWQEAGAGD
jgi:hemerythrin-like domain-containing protein